MIKLSTFKLLVVGLLISFSTMSQENEVFTGDSLKYTVEYKEEFIEMKLPPSIAQVIDSMNGIYVYYNGPISNVSGRNVTADGYNLGLKYQCVEFVKRYYYEYFNHKMPDSYGHAKDFFNINLKDSTLNTQRNLFQYTHPSSKKPQVNDLLVFDATAENAFGHVAIISKVEEDSIEIVQQNPVLSNSSRETFRLFYNEGYWRIEQETILGWLRRGE